MKNCMNVAAGVFGVMVPVALLVCGWNVLAPEKWCWVERGISIWGGAIATAFLFLFAAGYEHEKKDRANAPRNARSPKIAHFTMSESIPPCQAPAKVGKPRFSEVSEENLLGVAGNVSFPAKTGCQAPAKVGKKD